MAMQLNIGEAKSRLSQMVAASLRGEEVILLRSGKPVARITALEDAIVDEAARQKAERAAKIKAWIGSGKGMFGPNAGDLLLEPEYTNEELDSFSDGIGN
jgi:antitoxin (DNA-binding transcriptional repressor) of toxin-antitoxin stability system